jgi:hypothetical protein
VGAPIRRFMTRYFNQLVEIPLIGVRQQYPPVYGPQRQVCTITSCLVNISRLIGSCQSASQRITSNDIEQGCYQGSLMCNEGNTSFFTDYLRGLRVVKGDMSSDCAGAERYMRAYRKVDGVDNLKVARKWRSPPCEPHQTWLSRHQMPARACRSSSL